MRIPRGFDTRVIGGRGTIPPCRTICRGTLQACAVHSARHQRPQHHHRRKGAEYPPHRPYQRTHQSEYQAERRTENVPVPPAVHQFLPQNRPLPLLGHQHPCDGIEHGPGAEDQHRTDHQRADQQRIPPQICGDAPAYTADPAILAAGQAAVANPVVYTRRRTPRIRRRTGRIRCRSTSGRCGPSGTGRTSLPGEPGSGCSGETGRSCGTGRAGRTAGERSAVVPPAVRRRPAAIGLRTL